MTEEKSIQMLTKAAHRTTLATLDRAIAVLTDDSLTTRDKMVRTEHAACVLRRAEDEMRPVMKALK